MCHISGSGQFGDNVIIVVVAGSIKPAVAAIQERLLRHGMPNESLHRLYGRVDRRPTGSIVEESAALQTSEAEKWLRWGNIVRVTIGESVAWLALLRQIADG